MAIPSYQLIMLPLLEAVEDGKEHELASITEQLANEFGVSSKDRIKKFEGGQAVFGNRVQWAKKYLTEAQLLAKTGLGCFKITARGRKVLQRKPATIDRQFLRSFPEFERYLTRSKSRPKRRIG